jgi:ABC-type transporter Mla subunit MlaD
MKTTLEQMQARVSKLLAEAEKLLEWIDSAEEVQGGTSAEIAALAAPVAEMLDKLAKAAERIDKQREQSEGEVEFLQDISGKMDDVRTYLEDLVRAIEGYEDSPD